MSSYDPRSWGHLPKELFGACLDGSRELPYLIFGVDYQLGRAFGLLPNFPADAKILVTQFSSLAFALANQRRQNPAPIIWRAPFWQGWSGRHPNRPELCKKFSC